MIALGCVLGRMGNQNLPAFLGDPAQLAAIFAAGSQGDIQLAVDPSHLGQPIFPGQADYLAYDLHKATLALTDNPPYPARSERVAVLYANLYAPHHGVFGMMFDRGFATWDDPNDVPIFTSSPREGCAIFLDAIANLRSGFEYEREVLFTTVHEMGHLFNLQHVSAPSFMAVSKPDATYPPSAFAFLAEQRAILSTCSTSPYVWPGGAPFDEDNDWSQGADLPVGDSQSGAFGLELAISMSGHEFWRFEAVELDVEIRVAPGIKRRFSVPDQIDPGYRQFVIWLENPRGERRRYRSPRRYCAAPATTAITPARPFRRDISIFGEAGGYTFSSSGLWRIWVEFEIGKGRTLRSNRLELNVKPRANSRAYEAAFARLADPKSAALLYHRVVRPGSDAIATLAAQADDPHSAVPVAGIEYAIGRALAAPSRMRKRGWKSRAREYLMRARDRQELGAVQREHADRTLANIT